MNPVAPIEDQISGMADIKKSVAYAFPNSHLASRYNGGRAFFYVEMNTPVSCCPAFGEMSLNLPANRFETVTEAENAADNFPFDWWYLYRQYPLRDSRFFPGNLPGIPL